MADWDRILRLIACGCKHRLIGVTADNLSNDTKIVAIEGRAQRGEDAYEELMADIPVRMLLFIGSNGGITW